MSASPQETITLTFGDCAENHRGMQAMGQMASNGISNAELDLIAAHITEKYSKASSDDAYKIKCELIDLSVEIPCKNPIDKVLPPAKLLIIRNGIRLFNSSGSAAMIEEQSKFERDKKALMYGRVVNKKARHNLCFSDFDQLPDYEQGKGTVINFTHTPELSNIREQLPIIMNCDKLQSLQCEANYYYDIKKTYIGFHGDTERRIVCGLRLGATFPLHYRWFYQCQPASDLFSIDLHDGDIYIMSEKAVGFDWKNKSKYTLRHAAGFEGNISGK